jgi:secreted PhoX family phosphatase
MKHNRHPRSAEDADKQSYPLDERSHYGHPFHAVLQARLSRREVLRGGLGLASGTVFAGAGLSGCGGDSGSGGDGDGEGEGDTPALNFESVAGVAGDDVNAVSVPEGYTWDALIPWGTGIVGSFPGFKADGSNSANEQEQQTGDWHDGMKFFARNGSRTEGVLTVNHESLDLLFFHGYTRDGDGAPVSNRKESDGLPTDVEQVRKEIAAHGVSVVPLKRFGGRWRLTSNGFNRRVTADTPMTFSGPGAGSAALRTKFSPGGTEGRGTLNNCGRGSTPWNTYLTCEENFRGYLTTQEDSRPEEKKRYLINDFGFGYLWHGVAGDTSESDDEFARWDTTPSASDATGDYRNEANHFGWVVEIDPFDPSKKPKKRTAMGRFAHEGAQSGLVEPGKPIAFYLGDDDENEYIYKFVTADPWDPNNPDPDMLDKGTLYAAKSNADGSGEWLALDIDQSSALKSKFSSQAEVLTFARLAADELGATPMDRPEWSTTDPNTGEIYFTLTNNDEKGEDPDTPNEANPRDPNSYGHIIRHRENDDDPAATGFEWDLFVFGAPAAADASVNRSGLTASNQFAAPDGLWFDPRGVLWIETDNGGNEVAQETNNQLLAVVPSRLSDQRNVDPAASGPAVDSGDAGQLKRFLVGPGRCEVTGIELSPDNKTLFVNIQHPGQDFGKAPSHSFPNLNGDGNPSALPRSTTIAIRRIDGGEIALSV